MGSSYIRGLVSGAVAIAVLAWATSAFAQVRQFDVPSEDAGKSIPEFARQAQIQIIAPGDQLFGVITPQIRGAYDVSAALDLMLEGTGLKAGRPADGVVIVSPLIKRKREQTGEVRPKKSTSIFDLLLNLVGGNSISARAPVAQRQPRPTESVETVVVTGTSIHGVAPIGSNLITVGQDDIQSVAAQDVQQLMQTIPS